MAFMIQFLVVA